MKYDVITGNPIIANIGKGKYVVVYANPSENWKITEYNNLTFSEVAKLPFVNKSLLKFLK